MTPFAEAYRKRLEGKPNPDRGLILAELVGEWMQGRDEYIQVLKKRLYKLETKGTDA